MLNVILKGTNGCNLACSYCSLGKKENVKYVDETRLREVFYYVCHVCRYRGERELTIILHGGEPTLISPEIYDKALSAIKEEFKEIKISVLMQTNGYFISDKMVEFIKKYDISVGISIDGSKAVHDAQRCLLNGRKTFDRVAKNIDKLLEEEILVSCLMVLTSHGLHQGFEFLRFYEERNLHLKINPLLNYGEVYEHPELSLKAGEYAKYLIEMYRYIAKENMQVHVSPLDKMLQGILSGGTIRECTFCCDCNKDFLCIDYLGDIYPCGKYADMAEYKLGNVYEQNYNLLEQPIMQMLLNRRCTNIPEKCRKCKYIHLCHAGCNAEASIDGNIHAEPILCADYQKLFAYFHGEGLHILRRQLVEEKEKLERIQNGV